MLRSLFAMLVGRESVFGRSKPRVIAYLVLAAISLFLAWGQARRTLKPLLKDTKIRVLPDSGDSNGERFGLPVVKRKAIFAEFAAAEPASIRNGHASFPTEAWSAEDHRGSFERDLARGIASRNGLSLSQVYLVLDEGIRNHWPGPDGKPLSPQVTPLKPRRKY